MPAGLTAIEIGGEWRWLVVLTASPNLALLAALILRADLRRSTIEATERNDTAPPPPPLLLGCDLLAAVSPIVVGPAAANWLPSLLARTRGRSRPG